VNSELNKLFGRDFVIGFFVPALVFAAATFFLARVVWPCAAWLRVDWTKPLEGAGLFLLLTWGLAVVLQSVNREIFRAMEGYWPLGLTDKFNLSQKKRFRQLEKDINALKTKAQSLRKEEKTELNKLRYKRAMSYPSKERLILPTSFGNTVRAYEDYPRVVYGVESITAWTRLQVVMSKDFREILGNDRARVDLWLNLCVLSPVFAFELAFIARLENPIIVLFALLPLVFAWFCYLRARSSAQQFGEQVKAAFDLYLPALAQKLGYELSPDTKRNEQFWQDFRAVMLFRDHDELKKMAQAGLKRLPNAAPERPEKSGED
jgi:hypothetical protein